jgi:argininosuccinate lyase
VADVVRGAPPEGYLGAHGKIDRAPAPELIDAGFSMELDDACLLHRELALSHLAHVLELDDAGVIPAEQATELLRGLLRMYDIPAQEFPYDPSFGDPFNSQERWLQLRIGDSAGWLAAGRARREAGRVAYRIVLARELESLVSASVRLGTALVSRAWETADVPSPDYTYLQVAQLTTFGHYLLSFAYPVLRDLDRLERVHDWTRGSPAGVGAVAGSRFPLDRVRLAARLGFAEAIPHARDAMWQTDGLGDALMCAVSLTSNCSALASDVEIYGSAEFGFIEVDASVSRASAVMPQKRNPYAIPVIRGLAGLLIGRMTGVMAMQRTPSARTDNALFSFHETVEAVRTAEDAVELMAAMIETLGVDRARLAARAADLHAVATDLAEAISLSTGIDYRRAYNVVARAVAVIDREPDAPLTSDRILEQLESAALSVIGEPLGLLPGDIAWIGDPGAVLRDRSTLGGPSGAHLSSMLNACQDKLDSASAWVASARERVAGAEAALLAEARGRALGR